MHTDASNRTTRAYNIRLNRLFVAVFRASASSHTIGPVGKCITISFKGGDTNDVDVNNNWIQMVYARAPTLDKFRRNTEWKRRVHRSYYVSAVYTI